MKKFVSWNVNGLRACMEKGFMDFFNKTSADVFCIQETKMQKEQANFSFDGYYDYWNSADKKGYSGTLMLSKEKPLSVSYGIDGAYNDEGRLITLEFADYYITTSYSPNAQPELKRIEYRMQYEEDMRMYLSNLARQKTVILCGDLNVAHNEIDLKNPKSNVGNPGFSYEERSCFSALLGAGFTDSYRHIYPDKCDAYTWWSYRSNARAKNVGWRIDYFVVSNNAQNRIVDSLIYPDVLGSDHCPVGLVMEF